jgi:lysophospholipase L1-like esterase
MIHKEFPRLMKIKAGGRGNAKVGSFPMQPNSRISFLRPRLTRITTLWFLLLHFTLASAWAESRTPVQTGRIIDYYGDSTVWGYATGIGAQVATPAPVAFAEALPASLKYEVRNEGISGTTACQLLHGTDGKHPAWPSQMKSSRARIVIINHAINDQWKDDISTYKSCLHALAQVAKKSGKKVVFETPNPTLNSGKGGLDAYVNAMKEVALQARIPVIDQYQFLTSYLQGSSPYTICPDGLHPTDEVYIMKGKFAARAFLRLFHGKQAAQAM